MEIERRNEHAVSFVKYHCVFALYVIEKRVLCVVRFKEIYRRLISLAFLLPWCLLRRAFISRVIHNAILPRVHFLSVHVRHQLHLDIAIN